MKSPELLEATASEPLSLEEEYEMQSESMVSRIQRPEADGERFIQQNGIWTMTVSPSATKDSSQADVVLPKN